MKLRVLGVCQGQGALLFPLKKYLVGNIEPRGCFHTPKEEQWQLNFGDIPFPKKFEPEDKSYFGKCVREANVIIGSPNCGTSSILSFSRKKSFGKPKEDDSINLYLDMVKLVKPDIFIMENLPKLLDFITESEWYEMFPDYNIVFHNHSVSAFGNSQLSRVRLLLVAVRKDSRVNLKHFKKIYKVRKPKSTSELMDDKRLDPVNWPLNGNRREPDEHKVCMYDYRDANKTKLSLGEIRELWQKDFSQYYKWPINSARMKTLPGVYRNKPEGFPMTARKQDRQFRPDGVIMSPGELAVIQGFPNRYKLYMETNDSKKNYWINKGRVTVTKGPSYEMGVWIKQCLKKALK